MPETWAYWPRTDPPRLANPIYGEVVPRDLTAALLSDILQEAAW